MLSIFLGRNFFIIIPVVLVVLVALVVLVDLVVHHLEITNFRFSGEL